MHDPTAQRASWRPLTGLLALLAGVMAIAFGAAPAHGATPAATSIVQLRHGVSAQDGERAVRAAGGRATGRLPIIDGLAARLDARGERALRHDPRVLHVSPNGAVRPQAYDMRSIVTAYPASVSADRAWSSPAGQYTGKGVGVAVIDTGIAGDLTDFRDAGGSSRVVASVVTNPQAVTSGDSYGHGTHVAGILAGDGTRRSPGDPLRGDYVGIAPEASLISVKASDELGNATVLDVINGLQFVVDHEDDLNIRIVNLSLESSVAQSYKTDPLDAAVESAWLHGIVVVAAAGNHGATAEAADYAPGNDPYVITVGGVDDQGTKRTDDDVPADWSSVGKTQDGFAKPEVMAPGAGIVSDLAPGSAFSALCPACIVSGAYIRAGGTSMAAPVVSGVAALMLQRHPDWTPNQVKGTLVGTARGLASSSVPEVNAGAAVGAPGPPRGDRTNAGLTPNALVDAATGSIDYTRSSWSRSSWSTAPDALSAGFARSSWSCQCRQAGDGVDPSRSSWSRSSWSTKWTY
jgi:serine protease AprX